MRDIKLLCMDVDGTLTDGRIYVGETGEMFKAFDVKDGYAICHILPDVNITPIIITGRKSRLLERRCEELGIDFLYQGVMNKAELLGRIASNLGVSLSEVAYIGDDLNDLPCMEAIANKGGTVGCPADACREVLDVADYVSKRLGGQGAVREFIEYLVSQN